MSVGSILEERKRAQAACTLRDFIDGFDRYRSKTALIAFTKDSSTKLKYGELLDTVKQLSCGLSKHGLKKGETALILAANSPAWIISCLSVIYSGAVAVPVDSQQSDESLKHILTDCRAQWIFTDARGHERLRKLFPRRHLKLVILDDEQDASSWTNLTSKSSLTRLDMDKEDVAILFYTSGTTGLPKGVPLRHSNILMQLDAVATHQDLLLPSDRLLLPLPLFHVYPLNDGLFSPLRMGLPVILPYSLTGPEIMRAIDKGQATVLVGVPRLLRSLYAAIEKRFHSSKIGGIIFDAVIKSCQAADRICGLLPGKILFHPVRRKFGPTLRLFTSGGAPLDANLAGKLRALGWDVAVGYGLTETAPLLTMRISKNRDLFSVGKPIAGVKIRISARNEASEEKGDGEIEVQGSNVFSGYLNLPDETQEAFTKDGWFKTGDLGHFENGNLHITGRASSMIVSEGGKHIQPDSIEERFAEHSAIREIGVLETEHKLVALVVPDLKATGESDVTKTIADALTSLSSGLPSYYRITDFAITREPLPRTNLGKLKRHELQGRFQKAKSDLQGKITGDSGPIPVDEMSEEDRALLEHPAASQCWEWLSKQFPDQRLTPDTSPQLELNIDSLEWMNLTLDLLEQTGVDLDEDAIARIGTVRDLLSESVAASQRGYEDRRSPFEEPEKFLDDKQEHWLKPLNPFEAGLAGILLPLNRTLMRVLFQITPVGLDRLPNTQLVFTPNHASYLDAFALSAALPDERLRETQWAGWTGIAFHNPFNSFMSRLLQAFPIEAKRSVVSSFALGAGVLKRGKSMVWFPEGERTLTGELLEFKQGIGMLLERRPALVVPVYLDGTREALPPGGFFPHFGTIRVIFGEPVNSRQLSKEGKGKTVPERIVNALHDRVAALKAGNQNQGNSPGRAASRR